MIINKKLFNILFSILLIAIVFEIVFQSVAHFVILPWRHQGDLSFNLIAHGGGEIDSHIYTNSKEAVELSISRGFKLVELDLIETEDGHLIGGHDWMSFKKYNFIEPISDDPLKLKSLETFKILKKYTVLNEKNISTFFSKYSDFNLVTDKTNNFALLNKLENKDRIYVEVFGLKNYIKAIFYNIKHPIYSMGKGGDGGVIQYIKIFLLNPKYVVANIYALKHQESLFNWIHSRGIKIFVYTSNDPDFINWAVTKFDATVYTDCVNVKNSIFENNLCEFN
jgi:glycerophosphoryl diester phosphodiesterase